MTQGWLDSNTFYFNAIIEQHVEVIQSEFLSILEKGLLVPYAHRKEENGVTQLIKDGWSGYLLRNKTTWIEESEAHAPETIRLLRSFPELENQKRGTFGFSVIFKKSKIFTHTNTMGANARHRHQLCLSKFSDPENLFLEVNGDRRSWGYGKVISFDDGYPHSVTNNTNYDRVVLIYDSVPADS